MKWERMNGKEEEISPAASKKYHHLQDEYREAANTVQEQKLLIVQLEEDLRSVNALSSMFRGEAEGGEPVKTPGGTGEVELVTEAVKDIVSQGGDKTAVDSILPIVQSQRERYRVRAQELEAHSLGQQQQISLLQNEIDKLRSDNVKMYEKIRFLQSYPKKGTTGSEDAETRYSSQYEEKLDPFSTFSRKERQRKYMNLKPYDKITLSMGRFIMGNKIARSFTFFYTLLLHSLVFLVLYKLAHTETSKREFAAECHEKFAAHMMEVHGEKNNHIMHA